MSTELYVALIASFSSLVVAIVSVIASIVTGRQNQKSTLLLEQLKYELEKERVSDDRIKGKIKITHQALQEIQRAKDVLALILASENSGMDADIAISYIKESRQRIFDYYEKFHTEVDDIERTICHQVKSHLIAIEQDVIRALENKQHASEISKYDRRKMREMRLQLSEYQQSLRDHSPSSSHGRGGI